MPFCRGRSWLPAGLSLAIAILIDSSLLFGQSGLSPSFSLEQYVEQAARLELEGKWNEALQLWCKVYGEDRQNHEANKHIQNCLRRLFQAQRQVDVSVREKVLRLSHSQALALYGEALNTLNAAYVDRAKVTPGRLFQQGLDEFLLSLNDRNFRKQHLREISENDIGEFQKRLRELTSAKTIETVPQAVTLVKQIAVSAKRDLRIGQTSVVVMEFVSGACNSLDEYTAYLSPAELALEMSISTEPSVIDTHMLKEGVGYFKISHFKESTADEVDAALSTLRSAPPMVGLRALVIDLRGNPGGLFSAAVQVVERFVPEGVIASTQGQLDEFNKVLNVGNRMNVNDVPLVLLVDGGTASAAEMLAGALRDHHRATLIGAQTYGKGSIQRILQFQTAEELDEGGKAKSRSGGLRITLARFLTPGGQPVNGTGVAPHVVEPDPMLQVDLAIEHVSRLVSTIMPR